MLKLNPGKVIPVAIQTCRPRLEMAKRLSEKLIGYGFSSVEVSNDSEMRGSRWNMDRILRSHPQGVLVIQDDVVIGDWFKEQFYASLIDGANMTYFASASYHLSKAESMKKLYTLGFSYIRVWKITGLANYFTPDFIRLYFAHKFRPGGRSDDDVAISEVATHYDFPFHLTLPHLVDHREVPSVVGNVERPNGKARVSYLYGEQYLRKWDKRRVYDLDATRFVHVPRKKSKTLPE